MKKKKLHPVHPGEVLFEDFLKHMGLTQNKLALNIGVPARRINEIVLEKRKITADTALRYSHRLHMSLRTKLGNLTVDQLQGTHLGSGAFMLSYIKKLTAGHPP